MTITVQHLIQIPWADRWIGGFCPLGALDGLPVRESGYPAHPSLSHLLPLPQGHYPSATLEKATQVWSEWCGGAEVALVCSLDRAWRLLLCAAQVETDEAVGLPANANYALTEAVKQYGAKPHFLALNLELSLQANPDYRINWAQSVQGLPASGASWADYSATLPHPGLPNHAVSVYGLQLSNKAHQSGALVVFGDPDLARRFKGQLMPKDMANSTLAVAQYERWAGLFPQHQAILQEVWHGLSQASGLCLLPLADRGGTALGVAVQIPPESDSPTFYTYAKEENTPVLWLPLIQPLHYAAIREVGRHAESAGHLARWLFVPVGPAYTAEEIKHAVLGIVKASEYLGVRWRTDPLRARDYATMMTQLYGPGHDAYQPVFALER